MRNTVNRKIKNATPKEYKGICFRSKLEARSAEILDENSVSYQYEPFKIEYIPTFKYRDKTFRKAQYTPDFVIDNKYILELKGFNNDLWSYKKKLILLALMKRDNAYSFYEIRTLTQLRAWIKLYKDNNLNEVNGKNFV